LDKPDDRTPSDAIIALCMSVDSVENRPEPVRLLGFRVKRRCITCRRLIDRGSYCPACLPRPADPGRIRGRRDQERRARLIEAQGGRCGRCGGGGALELHHRDHDPANDNPANHVMPCRRCHRLVGGLSR
jgi:hypothetical protein